MTPPFVLADGLPDDWITASEGPDTFTPFDNVGHLIHGERTDWIPRARLILAQSARVTAKRHRDAVGPWRANLPILDR